MLAISIILPADDIHTLSVDKDFTDDMVWRLRLSTLKVWIRKSRGISKSCTDSKWSLSIIEKNTRIGSHRRRILKRNSIRVTYTYRVYAVRLNISTSRAWVVLVMGVWLLSQGKVLVLTPQKSPALKIRGHAVAGVSLAQTIFWTTKWRGCEGLASWRGRYYIGY